MRVTRKTGPDRKIYVQVEQPDAVTTMEELAHVVAREILRGIFPIAGSSLDKARKAPKAHVIVAVRGAYEYNEAHLRTLRAWLTWSGARPRRAVRFEYEGTKRGTREVWALGIVTRDLARVYLLGVPVDSFDARDVRTYALERASGMIVHDTPEGDAPRGLDTAVIEESMDLPFSISNARDGSLDLEFGPADLGEACAPIRAMGRWRRGDWRRPNKTRSHKKSMNTVERLGARPVSLGT